MNFDFRICAAAAALLGFACMASSASAQPVSGSFQATCRNIQTYGNALTADCRDPSGHYHTSSIGTDNCRGDIGNNNGTLFCNAGNAPGRNNSYGGPQQVSGSFQRTCRRIEVSGGMLTAECRDPSGHYHGSSLAYAQCNGDIGNDNGSLFCNGSMGGYGGNSGRDPGRGR